MRFYMFIRKIYTYLNAHKRNIITKHTSNVKALVVNSNTSKKVKKKCKMLFKGSKQHVLTYLWIFYIQQSYSINSTLLSNILNQFKDYHVVIHHHGFYMEILDHLLHHLTEKPQPVQLINYDSSFNISKSEVRLLHLIFLKDISYIERYTLSNLNKEDVVLIASQEVLDKNQQVRMCRRNNLQRTKLVFMVTVDRKNISICCYYCGKEKVTIKTILVENDTTLNMVKFINNYTDFGGYTFHIGYNDFPPLFYNKSGNLFYGPEYCVLDAASKLFNFSYTLVEYSGNATNGGSDVAVDQIRCGEIDWALGGISQNFMRTKTENVEYTRYMWFQSYMAIYQPNEDEWLLVRQLIDFLYISKWGSYSIMAIGIFGIALVTKLSLKYSGQPSSGIGTYAIMTVLYLIDQQSTKLRRKMRQWKPSIKMIFIIWMITCVSLITNYKSLQTYFLMTEQAGPHNLDEFVQMNFKLQIMSDDYANLKLHCRDSTSKLCSEMLKILHVFSDHECECFKNVVNDKVALIQEEEPLKYKALMRCNLTFLEKQSLKFVTASIISKEWHAWPFQKSAPYIGTFSRLIGRIESTGLLPHWYTGELKVYRNFYSDKETHLRRERRPLRISDFIYPFVVLSIGHTISIILFLKEIYRPKSKTPIIV